MASQEATQLRISSCHQESPGSSRLMSQLGDEARFKGWVRLAQSVGLSGGKKTQSRTPPTMTWALM